MATGPQLVHKQFNSPIGLYSKQNIEETLNKHLHHLDNGATGIDFNDPATGKPGNLANSAVLRMLEEEERTRRGYPKLDPTQVQAILDTLTHASHPFDDIWPHRCRPKLRSAKSWEGNLDKTYYFPPGSRRAVPADQKKVVWPPAPETNGYHQQSQQAPAYIKPPQQQNPQYQSQAPQYNSQPQYQQQQYQQPQQPQQQYEHPQQPAYCEGRRQEQPAINRLIPVSAGHSPQYRAAPLSPKAGSQSSPLSQQSRWAPVPSPQPSANYQQPSYAPQQQYSPQQQQYSPQQQQYSPQPQYQPHFEPPPTTVTLRPHPPIHQQPSPVFASQPAAASFQGGANMRGDMKWPPQSVKDAVAAENEARRLLAKGPACRPRKVRRDYGPFFAKNALNQTYPGYRVPPGTQHMGQTSF